jgi:hypothetical protein
MNKRKNVHLSISNRPPPGQSPSTSNGESMARFGRKVGSQPE